MVGRTNREKKEVRDLTEDGAEVLCRGSWVRNALSVSRSLSLQMGAMAPPFLQCRAPFPTHLPGGGTQTKNKRCPGALRVLAGGLVEQSPWQTELHEKKHGGLGHSTHGRPLHESCQHHLSSLWG